MTVVNTKKLFAMVMLVAIVSACLWTIFPLPDRTRKIRDGNSYYLVHQERRYRFTPEWRWGYLEEASGLTGIIAVRQLGFFEITDAEYVSPVK